MPELLPETRERILKKALLSRFVDEQLLSLFSEGKIFGTVHTCIGQEMSGAVITEFLKKGDTVFSNHRCHGHFISFTGDLQGLIAELMGKTTGVCGGKGGSQHLFKDGFYSNGIQGGIVPVAAGLAKAHQYNKKENISVVFIGDGTLGEGAVYEAFNIASKWNLPLLIVLEDNGFAQSTSQEETLAGSIVGRGDAFGIKALTVDTWDWEHFYHSAKDFIEGVRSDSKPGLLVVKTFRLKAHSKGDDSRPRSEIEPFELKDPLNVFLSKADPKANHFINALRDTVSQSVQIADRADFPVFVPKIITALKLEWKEITLTKSRVVTALNKCFLSLMEKYQKMIFIGEDIKSPYGGAFKVSQGLSDLFPDRVKNTPISEACIVGVGSGLALAGYRPFVEIMFGDFLGLAFDQIVNHAAKFEDMYNGQVGVNLVIRTPMGGGRGYGPTHSQTLDRHFLGVPGLQVLALNHMMMPEQLYNSLLSQSCGPTLVLENKLLYSSFLLHTPAKGFKLLSSNERFPTAWYKPESNQVDITLLGYGGMSEALVEAAEVLFEKYDIVAQVICPSLIYPFSIDPLLPALMESRRLLIVEEGQSFAGFGAELIAQLSERAPQQPMRIKRLGPSDCCIPASGELEKQVLPGLASIIQNSLDLCQ